MSLATLEKHRERWRHKPVLARVYRPWFARMLAEAPRDARVLEVGAGPGFFTDAVRELRPDVKVVAMDVLETRWNDLVADGTHLPFADRTFGAVVGLDFVHHLAQPGVFLAEAARVLAPLGRVAVVEPWVTPLSYPIYRFLHQEGCRLTIDPWEPFGQSVRGHRKEAFVGDSALVWKLTRTATEADWRQRGLGPPRIQRLNAFAYLLSLGFKAASLLPARLVEPLQALDEGAAWAAPLVGLRAFVVWEKSGSGSERHLGKRDPNRGSGSEAGPA